MQTFTFDQLDERGQKAAHDRYKKEDYFPIKGTLSFETVAYYFTLWGVRFNEHGERVA